MSQGGIMLRVSSEGLKTYKLIIFSPEPSLITYMV